MQWQRIALAAGIVIAVARETMGAQQTDSSASPRSGAACELKIEKARVRDLGNPAGLQRIAPRPENQTLDKTLPGFIKIPGKASCVRLGAGASSVGNVTSKLMSQTWFVTSSIPVAGQPFARSSVQTAATANQTDVTVEFRSMTDLGSLRVLVNTNFAQPAPGFVLDFLQAYGQLGNVLVGLTSTTFSDVDAAPPTLDYQGPNALTFGNHMIIRYTYRLVPGSHVSIALEQPNSNVPISLLPAVVPRNAAPDAAINWRLEGSPGHLQLSGLARVVGTQNANTGENQTVPGLAGSLTGTYQITDLSSLMGGVAGGKGLGAYVNDTNGKQYDAANDAGGEFEAIPLVAAYAGYVHGWNKKLSSTATFGWLGLDDTEFSSSLGPKGLHQSKYAALNLVSTPFEGMLAGVEALWGRALAIDGSSGEAWRGALKFQFRY
jgi:hypothetical protein